MNNDKTVKLNLADLSKEATISVVASMDNKKIELPTEYAVLNDEEEKELTERFKDKYLPLENILKLWQDKLREVEFSGTLSKLSLIAITKEGVFHWENVKINKYTLQNGRHIHVAFSSNPVGEKYNRRRGVRINIDKRMNIEQNGEKISVIVRDLSYCGIAFVESAEIPVDPDKAFTINLIDTDEDGNEYLVAKLTGRINNQKEIDDGKILCGCILAADHASDLQRYIANKQIEAIRGKRLGKRLTKSVSGKNWQEKLIDELNK